MIYVVNKRTLEHRTFVGGTDWVSADWQVVHADPAGWIKWRGGECPLPDGVEYEVKHRDGDVVGREMAKSFDDHWDHMGLSSDIIAYRPILDTDTKPEAPAWDGE